MNSILSSVNILQWLTEVPSLIYGLQVTIAEILFICFIMPKRSLWWLRLALCAVASVAVCAFVPDLFVYDFLYLPLLIMITAVVITAFFVSSAKPNMVFFCLVATMLMQHTAECLTMVIRLLSHVVSDNWWYNVISVVCYALVYSLCIVLFRLRSKIIELKSWPILLISAVVFLGVFGIRNVFYALDIEFSSAVYIIINVYAAVCCVSLLLFLCSVNSEQHLITQNDIMEGLLKREREHYNRLVQNQDAINRKCHDLKYQLRALRENISDKEREQYLDKIEKDILIYDMIAKTGNVSLDRTLSEKYLYCTQNNIQFTYMVDAEGLEFMDSIDIYTLFGNTIDNAIECVIGYNDIDKRVISLRIFKAFGTLRIHLENYCEDSPMITDGQIETSKNDKNNHGFGLKSIRFITEKYNGYMTVTTEKKIFSLDIMIPIA